MTPKRPPNDSHDGTQKKAWEPPRGIWYSHRPDRPRKPFYLHWTDAQGERRKQGFKTEKDRETIARQMAKLREEHGTAILDFDPVKWRTWLEFERMVGVGVDPLRVASDWLATREGTGDTEPAVTRTVTEAWDTVRALRKKEERLYDDTWLHIDTHMRRFIGAFGLECLHRLKGKKVRDWLEALTNPRTGKPMSAQTKIHHLNDVNAFLDICVREGFITKNPCANVVRPELEDDGEVVVMAVQDAFEFFKANVNNPAVIRVALEAFGAVRYKSAGRMQHESINFEERGIELKGYITVTDEEKETEERLRAHKSGKRRFRQGHPDNLWAWLDLAQNAEHPTWKLELRQYAEAKREMLSKANLRPFVAVTDEDRAKLKELRNVWRHSCASYLLAKTKSFPTVQYLMQHKHASTTEIYEGVATERDAVLYGAITPQSVLLTWDEFVAKYGLKKEPETAIVAA